MPMNWAGNREKLYTYPNPAYERGICTKGYAKYKNSCNCQPNRAIKQPVIRIPELPAVFFRPANYRRLPYFALPGTT